MQTIKSLATVGDHPRKWIVRPKPNDMITIWALEIGKAGQEAQGMSLSETIRGAEIAL